LIQALGNNLLDKSADVVLALSRLDSKAEESFNRLLLRNHGPLVAVTLAQAVLDYSLSDKDIAEWIHSGKLLEYGSRAGVNMLANEVERKLEQRLIRSTGKETAEEAGLVLAKPVFRVRIVGMGAATLIFAAGEGLIGVLQGESGEEVAERIGDAIMFCAIYNGSVLFADIVFAEELGVFGGPVGLAIALGATGIYEGIKYALTAAKEHDADLRIYLTRCETTRDKTTKWSEKTQAVLGREKK
jgi:hypothetical protein